jgi:outer membrane receptor protein involved in Fe transport
VGSNGRSSLLFISLGVLAGPAFPLEDDAAIDEIIVTATKREVPVQGVPINISAFEEVRLREGNLFDINRLSQEIPGLNVIDYGTENHTLDIVLRGLNASRLQLWGGLRTTSIYLNDTVVDYTNFDINDVARVEVLRGPQGTLYGGGAVGGTIRYVTNKPDPNNISGWVEAGMSNYAGSEDFGWQTKVVLNTPIIDEKLALRLFASYKEVPGYITKIGFPDRPGLPTIRKEDQNSNDRYDARAALRWIMNDDIEATLAYTGQRLSTKGNGGATPGVGDVFTGLGGIVEESTEENVDLVTLDVVADLNFAEFTSNSAYYEERRPRLWDMTRYMLELSESLGWNYELFPQYTHDTDGYHKTERITQEFRLVSTTPDSLVEYVAGAFYRNQKDREGENQMRAPGLPDFLNEYYFGPGETSGRPDDNDFVAVQRTEVTEWALFGEVTFNLTERWNIVLGGRWFDYEISGYTDIALPMDEELLDKWGVPGCAPLQGGMDPTLFPCTYARTVMDNAIRDSVYKVNSSYQFERVDALLFATIAEGFRPGGANYVDSINNPAVGPKFRGYDPDTATSYEIGIKSMLFDDRLRLNASIYRIDWEGIQLDTKIYGWEVRTNGDDARIKGVELDMTTLISDAFQLDLSVTKLDAALTEDTLTTPEIDGQKGDRLPGSAEIQATLALRYETELTNSMRWWTRLAGAYSGDVTAYLNDNEINQLISPPELSENRFFDRLPSYTVWNLTTGLEGEQWSLFVYADNLFDEKYIVASSTFEQGPVDDPISRQHYFGRPRTVGVNLRYNF